MSRLIETIQNILLIDQATATITVIWIPVMILVLLGSRLVRPPAGRIVQASASTAGTPGFAARLGQRLFGILIATGLTPNQVTLSGLVLVLVNCAFYLYHRDAVLFGTGLIMSYVFDTLDGLVARATGQSSKFGGYLDAVTDRIQETVTLLVLGHVSGLWMPAFLALAGSMMTSYNKARLAIEIPVNNKGWPDFFDKTVRQFFLCFALLASDAIPWMLAAGLWLLAGAAWFTALQRMIRAYLLIEAHEGR